MQITVSTGHTAFDLSDARAALHAAINYEASLAYARRKAYERACQEFEIQFNITSEQFLKDFEAGQMGDDLAYFDWYAAKRGFDLWDRRTKILGGMSV